MLKLNRILLASDAPASAMGALRYAAPLARLAHAGLQVLRVVDTRVAVLPRWTDIFRSTEAFTALEAAGIEATKQLLAHPALAGLAVEERVLPGHPVDRILDAATQVDVVVMGIQTQKSTPGRAAGKIAQQIVHSCPVPILMVPTPCEATALPPFTADSPLPVHAILLTLHIAQYAPQAIELSQALAATCHAALHVLHVFEPDKVRTYPFAVDAGLSHNLEAVRALVRTRLEELFPDDTAGPAVQRLVLDGQPVEVIVQQVAAGQADLVVMSVHAYGGLQKLFTLSTVDAVLEQLTCPLLAIPFPHMLFS
jgi:nucleotide-binding universal stress UspA family protein